MKEKKKIIQLEAGEQKSFMQENKHPNSSIYMLQGILVLICMKRKQNSKLMEGKVSRQAVFPSLHNHQSGGWQ